MISTVRFLFIILLLAGLPACERAPTAPTPRPPAPEALSESVRQLTPAEASQLIASTPDLVIFDARRDWERQENGRMPKAQSLDWLNGEDYVTKELAKLDTSKPYLVFCAIGARSRLVLEKMSKLGFQRLHWLKGGFNAWVADGRPIEK